MSVPSAFLMWARRLLRRRWSRSINSCRSQGASSPSSCRSFTTRMPTALRSDHLRSARGISERYFEQALSSKLSSGKWADRVGNGLSRRQFFMVLWDRIERSTPAFSGRGCSVSQDETSRLCCLSLVWTTKRTTEFRWEDWWVDIASGALLARR